MNRFSIISDNTVNELCVRHIKLSSETHLITIFESWDTGKKIIYAKAQAITPKTYMDFKWDLQCGAYIDINDIDYAFICLDDIRNLITVLSNTAEVMEAFEGFVKKIVED